MTYQVAIPFKVCPDPSDFHKQVDALMAGSPTGELPERCRLLPEGTTLTLPEPPRRTIITYRQFEFVRGTLANGENVWSDEFSSPLLVEVATSLN